MKLDRNINSDGRGKYALINLRKALDFEQSQAVQNALNVLQAAEILEWGSGDPGNQFFVMKYGDPFTADALLAYAMSVKEFAERGLGENRMAPKEFDSWMEWHREILYEAETARLTKHRLPT